MSTAFKTELAHQTSVKEVTDFDKEKLKKVETQEKNPLPDKDGEMPPDMHFKDVLFTVNLRDLTVAFFPPMQPSPPRGSTTASRPPSRPSTRRSWRTRTRSRRTHSPRRRSSSRRSPPDLKQRISRKKNRDKMQKNIRIIREGIYYTAHRGQKKATYSILSL